MIQVKILIDILSSFKQIQKTKKKYVLLLIKNLLEILLGEASIDDNIVKLLDYLEKENLIENTVIIYTLIKVIFLNMATWIRGGSMKNLLLPFVILSK